MPGFFGPGGYHGRRIVGWLREVRALWTFLSKFLSRRNRSVRSRVRRRPTTLGSSSDQSLASRQIAAALPRMHLELVLTARGDCPARTRPFTTSCRSKRSDLELPEQIV